MGVPLRPPAWEEDEPFLPEEGVRVIGDYELLDEGRVGGMGIVYRARQRSLNRIVALKMIRFSHRPTVADRRRFQREAEAVARLRHDHIVQIYEAGEHEGHPYFSMEFMEGGDLGKELERCGGDPFPLRPAAEMLVAITRAVHHAHENGFLHRDLKPGNILLDASGRPYVTDFGLAKILLSSAETDAPSSTFDLQPASHLTRAGSAMGSPGYASPEQTTGGSEQVTRASDVFALGAIFYRLITGRSPFPMKWEPYLKAIRSPNVRKPAELNRIIDADLQAICLKCLKREPAQRYATAQDMAEDLQHWLQGEPVFARPVSRWERGWKWFRRHPVKAVMLTTIAASLVLAVGWFGQWQRAEKQRAGREVAQRRLVLKNAENHFADHRADLALTTLAGALRERPDHRAAAERLLNALAQRTFLAPSRQILPWPLDAGGLNSDGKLRVLGIGTNTITVMDVQSGRMLVHLTDAHSRVIRDVRFSPDGQRIVSAGADSNAVVWSARDGTRLLTLAHPAAVNHAEFSPDGSLLATAARDGAARLWNTTNGQPVGDVMAHDQAVRTARFSRDGRLILTASEDHTIRLWDALTTDAASESAHLPTAVLDACFAKDGQRIVTRTFDGQINTFSITQRTPWFPASADETAAAHQLLSLERTQRLAALRRTIAERIGGEILSIDLSADGLLFSAGFADGAARLWRTRDAEPLGEPLFHEAKVNCVRFSPDGLRLVTSTSKGKVRLWDVPTGQPLSDADQSPKSIVAVAFSKDGDWVISSAGLKFEVPKVKGDVPVWLPQFAESLAGVAANVKGAAQNGPELFPIDPTVWQNLTPTNQLTRWVKRAFANTTE